MAYYILILLFLVVSSFVKGIRFSERRKMILTRADFAGKERERELLINLAKKNLYYAYLYYFLSMASFIGMFLAPAL